MGLISRVSSRTYRFNMYNFSVGPPGDTSFQSPSGKLVRNGQNGRTPTTSLSLTSPLTNASINDIKSPYKLAKHGKIQLIIGPMFAGKSTELLRKIRVFEVALHRSLIVKYAEDKRYSVNGVS